jgi:alpha-mannosidase
MKFALEHQNPFVTGLVGGGNALPEKSFSWLTLSNSNVLLWALKPAEEGITYGFIARVWNLSSEPQRFSLSLATGIKSAKQTTHIETDLADAPVVGGILSASALASQLVTFRVFPQKK